MFNPLELETRLIVNDVWRFHAMRSRFVRLTGLRKPRHITEANALAEQVRMRLYELAERAECGDQAAVGALSVLPDAAPTLIAPELPGL